MTTLKEEIGAYEAMLDDLEIEHLGKWVIVHGGELAGSYETFEDAANDAIAFFGRGPYLIRQVGAPPLVLPTSVLYKPIHVNN